MYLTFDNLYGYLSGVYPIYVNDSVEAPLDFDDSKMYKIVGNDIIQLTESENDFYQTNKNIILQEIKDYNYLILYDYLPNTIQRDLENIKVFDFTILGLAKKKYYFQGRKVYCIYFDKEYPSTIIVRKDFTDIKVNGILNGITTTVSWYNLLGNVLTTKSFDVLFTVAQKEQYETERRKRTIEQMIGESKFTPLAPVVDYIYKYYSAILNDTTYVTSTYGNDYIKKYINLGDVSNFDNALDSDAADSQSFPITQYLNVVISTSNGITATVKDLMKYEFYRG